MDTYRSHRPDPRVAARDAGLRRVYRLTRWVGVGAVGAVGLLAAYVAQAKPGHSTDPSAATGAVGGAGAGARAASQAVPPAAAIPKLSTGGGSESLTPPPAAPAPVVTPQPVAPPPVVSGGS